VLSEVFSNVIRRLRKLNPPVMTLHTKLSLCMTLSPCFWNAGIHPPGIPRIIIRTASEEQISDQFFRLGDCAYSRIQCCRLQPLTIPTLLLTMLLMLIGGCPGSTAGGIKATTLGVMLALFRSRFRS
jgi:hypothetical protein